MEKLTQRELLTEAFPDIMKGFATATVAAAKALAPEITNPLSKVIEPVKQIKQAYSSQQPLSVLKDTLAKKTNIEFIKLVKQEQRTANPNKNSFQSKNVTLITFEATVYAKGTDRKYKKYA